MMATAADHHRRAVFVKEVPWGSVELGRLDKRGICRLARRIHR
jgi:hypothetical protein